MKKGFTLIELLAVIVILAIIALIATPIILGIINDAREESNERSIELYASAAKNAVAKYQLTGTSAPTSFKQLDIEYDGNVVCTTEELYEDGSIYLAGCSVNGDTVDYTYGTQQETLVAKVCTIERADASKYSVGDVVTCTLSESTDKFYVIEEAALTATTIQMLTEKNIHTTTYRQSDDAEYVAFSSSKYWTSSGYIYGNYPENLLYSTVEGYVGYLNTKLKNATGKLLDHNQAINIGCPSDGGQCPINDGGNAQDWVSSVSYWLGFVVDNYDYVDLIDEYGRFYSVEFNYDAGGVRPVITISTSDIQ